MQGPLVVTGMHRSGLSLAATLLHAAGASTEAGEICALQTEILRRSELNVAGWTRAQPVVTEQSRVEAAELVAQRALRGHVWGWTDARSTLLLDFWRTVSAEARFLFVYRMPWEVADSLFRAGTDAEAFSADPRLALEYWAHYNRLVLACMRADRQRCVLVSADAVAGNAARVIKLLGARFGLELTLPAEGVPEAARLGREATGSRWPGLVAANFPECMEVLGQLERAADLPGGPMGVAAPEREAVVRQLMEEWAERRRMQRELNRAKEHLEAVEAARAASAKQAEATLQNERKVLAERAEVARAEAVRLAARLAEQHANAEALTKQRDEVRQHAAGLQLRVNELRVHAEGLEQLRAEGRRRVEELRQHAENLAAREAEVRAHVEGLTARLTELTAHAAGLEKVLAETRQHAVGLEKLLADSRLHATGLDKMLAETRQHAGNLEAMLGEAQKNVASLQAAREQLQRQVEELQAAVVAGRERITQLETEGEGQWARIAELEREGEKLRGELVDAKRAWTMIKRLASAPFGGARKK